MFSEYSKYQFYMFKKTMLHLLYLLWLCFNLSLPLPGVLHLRPGVQQTYGFTTIGATGIKTSGVSSGLYGLTGPVVRYTTSLAKTPGVTLQGKPLDFTLVLKELKATRYLSWLQKSGVLQLINDGGKLIWILCTLRNFCAMSRQPCSLFYLSCQNIIFKKHISNKH